MILYCDTMKTATLRDLRYDFTKIEAWLKSGEEVQITKHAKPLCRILPESSCNTSAEQASKADFAAFRTHVWGRRNFSPEEVEEARFLETGEP